MNKLNKIGIGERGPPLMYPTINKYQNHIKVYQENEQVEQVL